MERLSRASHGPHVGEAQGGGATLSLLGGEGHPLAKIERYASSGRLRDLYTLEKHLSSCSHPPGPKRCSAR
jgi:hypothetical protein